MGDGRTRGWRRSASLGGPLPPGALLGVIKQQAAAGRGQARGARKSLPLPGGLKLVLSALITAQLRLSAHEGGGVGPAPEAGAPPCEVL
ncbi:hypothetical protein NDU88_008824 [Pleurodeles waltl]|uniref:Uncharacterized protein n=1 Tax=Pleurodeles waltl TaxID=8319 RepID=A0AAV7N8D1_PLEWA|nr:hypothetical protein NDU88_008824 [Pleurodeles waltl]